MMPFLQKINAFIKQYDLMPKMLAILLAVILWANLQNSQIGEISFTMIPEIINLPHDLIILEDIPKLRLTIKGKNEIIKTINITNARLYVDMSKPLIGRKHTYPVNIRSNEYLGNVEYFIEKEKLELTVHKIKYKIVPVEPLVIGELSPQYKKGIIVADPPYVKVSGADVVIDTIKSIKTYPLNIENESHTLHVQVHLHIKNFQKISVLPESVKLTIPIVPITGLLQLAVPIDIRNRKGDINYALKDKKVIVYIKKGAISAEVNESMFAAYINGDIEYIDNEAVRVPVQIEKKLKLPVDIYTYEPTETDVILSQIER